MAGITAIKRIGYLHGGVTHPDGRRGFFAGAEKDSRNKGTSMSPGTDSKGNQRDQSSSGQRDDLRNYNFNPNTPNPDGTPNRFEQAKKNRDAERRNPPAPIRTNLKPSYYQNFLNKRYQNSINRNKVLAMRQLGLMKKGLPGLTGAIISGVTGQVPDWAKNMSQSDLMQIATSGPYLGQQTTLGKVSKFSDGKDLLNRVTEAQSILDTGNFSQTEYERLFPSNIPTTIGGEGNPYILPQYAMMGGGADMGSEDEEEKTFDYHLGLGGQDVGANVLRGYQANGGRITRAGGGIMNAVPRQGYFLGSIVKGVKKVVGGVADAAGKVLKSDVGKMALLAAGAYYTGGALGGTGGFNNFATLGSKAMQGAKFLGKKALFTDGALDFGKAAILGASALPFFMKQPEDPDIGMAERGGPLIDPITGQPAKPAEMRASLNNAIENADGDPDKIAAIEQAYAFLPPIQELGQYYPYQTYGVANGGRINKAEGGLMNLGGMEKDYRAEGGFVPIGKKEKADDVPARLSVNEFVFTADAVRNAGGGDIDKGAEVMENMMKNLEKGGRVSEESQGNTGAQNMFSVSERIGEVI